MTSMEGMETVPPASTENSNEQQQNPTARLMITKMVSQAAYRCHLHTFEVTYYLHFKYLCFL